MKIMLQGSMQKLAWGYFQRVQLSAYYALSSSLSHTQHTHTHAHAQHTHTQQNN